MGNMTSFIMDNLGHIAPMLLSGLLGIIIMIERSIALVWTYPIDGYDNFFERVRVLVMRDRIPEAIALCERMREKPAARVVREGLMRANQPEQLIEHGLQIACSEASEKISARVAYLGTIANIATLFGLLGTILGLVQSFEAVGAANAADRATLLANGISVAMNATMFGLAVAIPCMIAFSYLQARSTKLNTQVDQSAIRTLDILQQRYFRTTNDTTPDGNEENFSAIRQHRGAS